MDPVTGCLARLRAHICPLSPRRGEGSPSSLDTSSKPLTFRRLLAIAPVRGLSLASLSFKDGTADGGIVCRALACTVNPWVMPEGGVPIA